MNSQRDTATITIQHTVAAPRETVFRAWTEPELLARWWWPPRFATMFTIDLRPGGAYSIRSAAQPDGTVLAISGVFREVQPPQRLVYTWRWEGADTAETLLTVVFSERAGQTTIALTHERFASEEDATNNRLGWQSCLDRLTARVGEWA